MSAPLVFIEARTGTGEASGGSLGLLSRARLLGGATAVVCGPDSAEVAAMSGRFGADLAWYCPDPVLDPELGAPQVDVLATLIREQGYDTVLFENSVVAADVAAGLAARLDAGVNWDLQDVVERDGQLVGSRLALGDSVAVDVGWVGPIRIAVFRVGLHEPREQPGAGEVRKIAPSFEPHSLVTKVIERIEVSTADGPDIGTAEVIVAGGRGLRDREALEQLEELASLLGGAVAVTLPIVDRGWYPHSRQVGQTGRKVRPRLYLACGVSGALGHRVGMEKSGVIVAINTDDAAPIFGIADGGVVGDLHDVVPELARLIRER